MLDIKKHKKGFTLIELIIVIAIIVILSAITVPRLSEFKDDAKIKADIANAKIIYNATASLVAQGELKDTTRQLVEKVGELEKLFDSIPTPKATIKDITDPKFYITINGGKIIIDAGDNGKGAIILPQLESDDIYPENVK